MFNFRHLILDASLGKTNHFEKIRLGKKGIGNPKADITLQRAQKAPAKELLQSQYLLRRGK